MCASSWLITVENGGPLNSKGAGGQEAAKINRLCVVQILLPNGTYMTLVSVVAHASCQCVYTLPCLPRGTHSVRHFVIRSGNPHSKDARYLLTMN